MKNLVLLLWVSLLFTACETGTRYDTNTSKKKSIIEDIKPEVIEDPTHADSYFIDQGEDDYADEIALANRELAEEDNAISEEISEISETKELPSQHFEGGEVGDGLTVKSIRKAEHDSYVRLVFDSEGSDKIGSYRVDYEPSENRIAVVLNGYRAFRAKFPTFDSSSIVEKMDFAKYLDDSGYKLYINLRENTKITAFALESPARLVIDVKKP